MMHERVRVFLFGPLAAARLSVIQRSFSTGGGGRGAINFLTRIVRSRLKWRDLFALPGLRGPEIPKYIERVYLDLLLTKSESINSLF